jgi:hypothetical protein
MESRVYISHLKDEEFDYDVKSPAWDLQYAPKSIGYPGVKIDSLFKDIVRMVLDNEENTKQTDWGTFVIKLTKTELIEFLSSEGYKNTIFPDVLHKKTPASLDVNTLLDTAKELADGEYLLVAQELY